MRLKVRLWAILLLVLGAGFACQLTSPTPASWSGTPTAKVRALTSTAIALTQESFSEPDILVTPSETTPVIVSTQTMQTTVTADGPWLVYPAPGGDGIHAYDLEAKTKTKINLPSPVYWEDLYRGRSPDGRKLIVRAGSPTETDALALYQVDFLTSEVKQITPLLSLLLQRKIVNEEGTLAFAVLEVITRPDGLAWSPDSRYLAFSAALDNQTSDLYIFDSLNNRVSRMNGLPTHNASPFWSLTNNRLISQELGRTSDGVGWRAENVTGVNVPEFNNQNTYYLPIPESQGEIFVGWLNNQTFVSYSLTAEGPKTLRQVNIENLDTSVIEAGSFDAVAIDPVSHTIAMTLSNENATPKGKVEGVYLLRPEEIDFQIQRGGIWSDLFWDSGGMFIASGPQGLFTVRPDGEGFLLSQEKTADLSPSGNWLIAWGDGSNSQVGARLYQPPSIYPLQTLTESSVQSVLWQPDSKAFFIQSESRLYYLSFPGLSFQEIESGFVDDEPLILALILEDGDGFD